MPELDEKAKFNSLLDAIKAPQAFDRDFLFDAFSYALAGMKNLQTEAPQIASMDVNPVQLAIYLVSEHAFYLQTHPAEKQEEIVKKEDYTVLLASIAADKYYTNEHLAYRMGSLASRYNPAMSTMNLYLNFILGMLSRYKQNDPEKTLVVDIMNKGFQMAKCVTSLLEQGFETEAFSTWRTLHENECILQVIAKYGQPVIARYLKHLRYGVAFRGGIPSKEETDAVFVEIKEGMHEIGLKSKDMKRYIEYGWLLGVKDVMSIPDFKFNFRDGVQRVAGLSQYSKVYEMSSEIAHSSPLLIYSKKDYFFLVTLLNLYESFFRLEKVFSTLFTATVGEAERKSYLQMRSLYFGELLAAYDLEKKRLASLSAK